MFLLSFLIVLGEVCSRQAELRTVGFEIRRDVGIIVSVDDRDDLSRSFGRPVSRRPTGSRRDACPAPRPPVASAARCRCEPERDTSRCLDRHRGRPASRAHRAVIVGNARHSALGMWTGRRFPACLKSRRYKRQLRAPQRAAPLTLKVRSQKAPYFLSLRKLSYRWLVSVPFK